MSLRLNKSRSHRQRRLWHTASVPSRSQGQIRLRLRQGSPFQVDLILIGCHKCGENWSFFENNLRKVKFCLKISRVKGGIPKNRALRSRRYRAEQVFRTSTFCGKLLQNGCSREQLVAGEKSPASKLYAAR